ncbi:MAG TPA: acetoin utilization protein AcuC, partial [Holosporales bacterium]|nr:acetoin utilization protein AcuC [Holosporales bacterium]
YGFGPIHPFNNDRFDAFAKAFRHHHLDQKVHLLTGRMASEEEIKRFHTLAYIQWIKRKSKEGRGFLDYGDTPVVPGIYEASAYVVGTVLEAVDQIMQGTLKRAFIPIAGLHHAKPEGTSGFCVFNDCAIAIHSLRKKYGVKKIAYVDIDVHHGDGVFYAFEEDPNLIFADIHEMDIFPGTGDSYEEGLGKGKGKKRNFPLPAGAGDEDFFEVWPQIEDLIKREDPDFIIFQCGADSLAGDPLASLYYSDRPHGHAAAQLCKLADTYSQGRLLALGGGGYNLENIGRAWTAVVKSLIEAHM